MALMQHERSKRSRSMFVQNPKAFLKYETGKLQCNAEILKYKKKQISRLAICDSRYTIGDGGSE